MNKKSIVDPKYLKYSKTNVYGICKLYIVADITARERESGKDTNFFKKILIPSYNWDIPIVALDTESNMKQD